MKKLTEKMHGIRGPWRVVVKGGEEPGDGGPLLFVKDSDGEHVAFVEGSAHRSPLVAAAPEMLNALGDAKDRMDMIARLLNGDPSPEDIREAYNLAYSGNQREVIEKVMGA